MDKFWPKYFHEHFPPLTCYLRFVTSWGGEEERFTMRLSNLHDLLTPALCKTMLSWVWAAHGRGSLWQRFEGILCGWGLVPSWNKNCRNIFLACNMHTRTVCASHLRIHCVRRGAVAIRPRRSECNLCTVAKRKSDRDKTRDKGQRHLCTAFHVWHTYYSFIPIFCNLYSEFVLHSLIPNAYIFVSYNSEMKKHLYCLISEHQQNTYASMLASFARVE